MPSHDHAVELQNLFLDPAQLRSEGSQTRAGNFRHTTIIRIGDHIEKVIHALAPNRRDDTELGEMRTDRVDERRLLADEEVPRPVQHEACLLLLTSCRNFKKSLQCRSHPHKAFRRASGMSALPPRADTSSCRRLERPAIRPSATGRRRVSVILAC